MTLDTGIERVREILKEICPNDGKWSFLSRDEKEKYQVPIKAPFGAKVMR